MAPRTVVNMRRLMIIQLINMRQVFTPKEEGVMDCGGCIPGPYTGSSDHLLNDDLCTNELMVGTSVLS